MSADFSDPKIGQAIQSISSKSATWILLHYPANPTSASQIVYLCSGTGSTIQGWRDAIAQGQDEVLFGYGEMEGKGLVMMFLTDKVGGVRRARAVVHSRAVAQLFPDHQAFLTISQPSQLTEELAEEKLGSYPRSEPSSHPLPAIPVGLSILPHESSSDRNIPQNIQAGVSGQSSDFPRDQPDISPTRQPLQPDSGGESLVSRYNLAFVDSDRSALGRGMSGTPGVHPLSENEPVSELAPPIRDSSGVPSSDVQPKTSIPSQGIASVELFSEPPRNRSLSSRLKGLPFRSSSNSVSNPSASPVTQTPEDYGYDTSSTPMENAHDFDPVSPPAPTSPSTSRFKASSLAKAFRRRRRSSGSEGIITPPGSVPASPHFADTDMGMNSGPPVPPKDAFSAQPDGKGLFGESVGPSTVAQWDGAVDAAEVSTRNTYESKGSSQGIVRHTSGGIQYTPPPSSMSPIRGSSATTITSQKGVPESVELRPTASASKALFNVSQNQIQHENEIQEKFRRDQEEREKAKKGPEQGPRAVADTNHTPEVDLTDEDDHEGLPYDRPEKEGDTHFEGPLLGAEVPTLARESNTSTSDQLRPHSMSAKSIDEQSAAERLAAAAEAHAARVKADREAEEARVEAEKIEINRLRLIEVAEAEAQKVEEDRPHQMELNRLEAEHHARLAEEERERRRVEAERIELERAEIERQEREKLELAEKARQAELEQQRLRDEARRVEAEAQRKQAVRAGLVKGKAEGRVMLSGWVTVQSTKSMIWRRRWFNLLPTEIRLYKMESDASPIQIIGLGPDSKISQTYEESQVKGSFKLVSQNMEYYLFTDSSDDKEVVLEGLNVAMS